MDFSCFSEKKLIIIRELPSIVAPNKSQARTKVIGRFKKLLPTIPDNCYLIFDGINIANKDFIDVVEKIANLSLSKQSVEKENAKKYVYDFLKPNSKSIKDDDVVFLINAVSPNDKKIDLDKLFIFLHKINVYSGGHKIITKEDIVTICSDSNDFIIWNLFKSLDEKDFYNCSFLIDKLTFFSHNVESDIVKTIFTLIGRYRLLLFVKDCLIKKIGKDEIWKRLSNFKKWTKVGTGYKRRVKLLSEVEDAEIEEEEIEIEENDEQEEVEGGKKKKPKKEKDTYSIGYFNGLFYSYGNQKAPIFSYTKDELIIINSILQKTLIKIRSGCSESEMKNVLELLCLVICNKLQKDNILDIFKSSFYK
jgi:hypothetical protein